MYYKVFRVLRILALVSVIFGSWALGLNQIVSSMVQHKALLAVQAEAECLDYGIPHALVAEGTTYCYASYSGSDFVLSLDELKKHKKAPVYQAQEACLVFEIPHAVVVNGEIYCFATYNGSEIVVSLSDLKAFYKQE